MGLRAPCPWPRPGPGTGKSGWAEKEEKGRGPCVTCLGPWSCVFAEVEWRDSQGSELASLNWWAGDTCLGAI